MAPGQTTVFHYPNDQRSALLWYHDHVMSVTKYDVYSGLAGVWIIRDERERELAGRSGGIHRFGGCQVICLTPTIPT